MDRHQLSFLKENDVLSNDMKNNARILHRNRLLSLRHTKTRKGYDLSIDVIWWSKALTEHMNMKFIVDFYFGVFQKILADY